MRPSSWVLAFTQHKGLDDTQPVGKVSTDWVDIGEVNNIIIGKDGAVKAVVLGMEAYKVIVDLPAPADRLNDSRKPS